jgi:ribosomal protein S18 acetylase RimI-like enzyme
METITIRKFDHTDVDDFIRLSKISFAEEAKASGLTPEDFEQETRRIFRWHMIPYRMLTSLMGIEWEGFVAEIGGKVVGGGMYSGRNKFMSISNLMVDPAYRRMGIGQALLIKRLARLTERGFPFVTAQVLETNSASLANLDKQAFKEYNRYSVYEHSLPIPVFEDEPIPPVRVKDIRRADREAFRALESKITPQTVQNINGSAESQYFLSGWQKIFLSFTHFTKWIKVLAIEGEPIAFLCASYQIHQHKGSLLQPIIADDNLMYLPVVINKAASWLNNAGKESMIMEIPDRQIQVSEYLLNHGWKKQYTWLELIKWLDT